MDWRDLQAAWNGDIEALRPLGDFVLVKPLVTTNDAGIIDPKTQRTKDGRWRLQNRETGNRFGTVIAVGAGDRVIQLVCQSCDLPQHRIDRGQETKKWRCSQCGGVDLHAGGGDAAWLADISRMPLGVSPGDVVIFPRVPANEVIINGEEFVLLHEESQIYGVVEEEIAA